MCENKNQPEAMLVEEPCLLVVGIFWWSTEKITKLILFFDFADDQLS